MFVPEARIHEGFLNLAERYIGQRQNIGTAVAELRRSPDIFTRIAWQFDEVVHYFNIYTNPNYSPSDFEIALMPNVMQAREVLKGRNLPTLIKLSADLSRENLRNGIKTFKEAEGLLARGESGIAENSWMFHRDIIDVEDLTSTVLLEVYALHARTLYPELRQQEVNPLIGLEEVLAVNFPHSDLFIAAKRWYRKDEGFDPQLVKKVASIDESKLKRNRPPIENPEYRLFEVKDPNAILAEDARAVLLGAQNPDQLMIEARLQVLLSGMKSRAGRVYLAHWEGSKIPRGVEVGGRAIGWTQNGVIKDTEGEMIGTYERIIENGGRYGDEQLMVLYLMSSKIRD